VKNKELADVTEKNLDLSKRIELLEAERASDKIKIRDDTGRINKLEKMISEKDEHIRSLDETFAKLREEVGRLTKQREDAIVDKNKAIANQVTAERKTNQEIEARAKIQGELANLREKRANSIRRESKSVENSTKDAKRILDLELEIKTLKEGKQRAIVLTQKSKDIEFEHPVDDVQVLEENKTKMEKQEKSVELKVLNVTKLPYSKQTKTSRINEETSKSSNGCGFYFGYLSERDKGEAIPAACVECSKSLDCMLVRVHQSNDSVKEIKKWYHL